MIVHFELSLLLQPALINAAFQVAQVELKIWSSGGLLDSFYGCRQTDETQRSYHCGNLSGSQTAKPDGIEFLQSY